MVGGACLCDVIGRAVIGQGISARGAAGLARGQMNETTTTSKKRLYSKVLKKDYISFIFAPCPSTG